MSIFRLLRTLFCVQLLIFGALTSAFAAGADDYPNRPIRMIVPYPPGGGGDIIGRLIGREIEKAVKQPVVIENKPGVAGNVGATFAARATPDGYTILLGTNGIFAANPSLYRNIAFNTMKDFAFISQVADAAIVLVVNPSVQAKTVQEFIALAKEKPGKLNVGSGGVGTGNHLAAELFMANAGIKLFHVPYRGTPPAHLDVLAGRIDSMFDQVASSLADIRAGKLRPLVVMSASRQDTLPDVPSITEVGLKGSQTSTWYGLVAPAGTPDAIVEKLSKAVVNATETPSVKEAFHRIGLQATGSTPQETRKYIASEMVKWKEVITKAHIEAN